MMAILILAALIAAVVIWVVMTHGAAITTIKADAEAVAARLKALEAKFPKL